MRDVRKKLSVNRSDVWMLILSVFVPPIPVLIRRGFFSRDFLLNVLLFVMFFIPAIAHAAYVIIETSKERDNDFAPVPSHDDLEDAETSGPNNGDFDVDLEANQRDLPQYDDVVATPVATTDNKVQK